MAGRRMPPLISSVRRSEETERPARATIGFPRSDHRCSRDRVFGGRRKSTRILLRDARVAFGRRWRGLADLRATTSRARGSSDRWGISSRAVSDVRRHPLDGRRSEGSWYRSWRRAQRPTMGSRDVADHAGWFKTRSVRATTREPTAARRQLIIVDDRFHPLSNEEADARVATSSSVSRLANRRAYAERPQAPAFVKPC